MLGHSGLSLSTPPPPFPTTHALSPLTPPSHPRIQWSEATAPGHSDGHGLTGCTADPAGTDDMLSKGTRSWGSFTSDVFSWSQWFGAPGRPVAGRQGCSGWANCGCARSSRALTAACVCDTHSGLRRTREGGEHTPLCSPAAQPGAGDGRERDKQPEAPGAGCRASVSPAAPVPGAHPPGRQTHVYGLCNRPSSRAYRKWVIDKQEGARRGLCPGKMCRQSCRALHWRPRYRDAIGGGDVRRPGDLGPRLTGPAWFL